MHKRLEFVFCIICLNHFSDRMAEIVKEELDLEEFEIKEEIVYSKEENLPSSTKEDTSAVHKDGIKIENTGIQGNLTDFYLST